MIERKAADHLVMIFHEKIREKVGKGLKKIAVLNDLSGLGKCSLTAAIPVISVMGVQACPLPTAILSNQTGYDSYYCDDYTDHLDHIMEEWQKRAFCPDGIYTGFVAGSAQIEKILKFLHLFRKEDTLVLTDPVMGDRGSAYDFLTQELCDQMRQLVMQADVITPNLTEAILLLYPLNQLEEKWQEFSGLENEMLRRKVEEIALKMKRQYHMKALVITGVDFIQEDGNVQIGNLILENGTSSWVVTEKYGGSYSGTGDLFASALSAGMVKGMSMKTCVEKAVTFLSKAIRDAVEEGTDRNDGVCFETYLYQLA